MSTRARGSVFLVGEKTEIRRDYSAETGEQSKAVDWQVRAMQDMAGRNL